MEPRSEIDRLINTISSSADVLEPAAYDAVCNFVRQSQTKSGAFADRGGTPDLYYSFFGFMICKAFNLNDELNKLQEFVFCSKTKNNKNLIDWSIEVLLRYSFKPTFAFKLKVSIKLLSRWLKERGNSDKVYLTFISLLMLNYFWGWNRCISLQIDKLTSAFLLNDHSPTSHLAAALCIRNHAQLGTDNLSALLMKNAHTNGGFVSFCDHETPDMLSTAVAIYALNQTDINIKAITADGLEFVSSHFDNGAFLSGDGDTTRDVEYTFYGLLALSSYAQQLNPDK